jgi:hypothetical protein
MNYFCLFCGHQMVMVKDDSWESKYSCQRGKCTGTLHVNKVDGWHYDFTNEIKHEGHWEGYKWIPKVNS